MSLEKQLTEIKDEIQKIDLKTNVLFEMVLESNKVLNITFTETDEIRTLLNGLSRKIVHIQDAITQGKCNE